jgi:7-alpha-hydroxysteroid dehydrogenase
MYDPSIFRLDGGVALITGAGAGIGRSIAKTFASAGAIVTVTDREPNAAELVAKEIISSGGRAISMRCDVTLESDLEATVNRTIAEFGKLK